LTPFPGRVIRTRHHGVLLHLGDDLGTQGGAGPHHVTGCNSQLLTAICLGGASVIRPALDVGGLIAARCSSGLVSTLLIRAGAVGRMDIGHDEVSEAPGEEPGSFDAAEFEENTSTHYGRMVHLDDKTITFANPEDAAEYVGFGLTPTG
jgi:hypothetical protein